MASEAMRWAWEKSRASNGSLLVLLAIADEQGRKGAAEMTVMEIARKSRLSERAAQNALRDLAEHGELTITGTGGRRTYTVGPVDNPEGGAVSAPLPVSRGADTAPRRICTPQNLHPPAEEKPQVSQGGAESAPQQIPDALKGSVVSGKRSKPSTSETPRPDIDRLCAHLADRIEANGSRRPVITKRWKNSARLLLDKDGMTEQQVHDAIDWAQQHHFWHRNILSMDKLRQQYDRLRLDAKAEREKNARRAPNSHQPTPGEFDALRQNWARPLDQQEAGNDPRGNDRPDRIHRGRLPAAEDRPGNGSPLV